MNDEQKTPPEEDQPADTPPVEERETTGQPAAEDAPAAGSSGSRTRNTLIAGGAGLALAGGLIGFGIGHASADGDGDRFRQVSQHAPGEGRPDFRDGDRPDRRPDGDRDRQLRDGDSDDQPSADDPA